MKVFVLKMLISLYFTNICFSQDSNEFVISGQQELNSYVFNDSILNGSLSLYGDIYDLSKLGTINEIRGSLSLNGLEHVTDLNGLEKLQTIGNVLSIQNCKNLISLNGLNNLQEIGGMFRLTGNQKLKTLNGLDKLISFRHLELNRTYLKNLEGMTCIQQIGSMGIHDNLNLVNFAGLEKINSFARGTVEISGNNNLETLKGLENLKDLGKLNNLYIRYNLKLHSIEHINSLHYNSISNFAIAGNPNLCDCNIKSLKDYVTHRRTAEINNNCDGCNSIDEIISSLKKR